MKSWKSIALLAVVLIAAFFLFKFFRGPQYENFPPTARGPWIAFGDSLTAGFGAAEGSDYPTLLGASLGVSIKNFGRSGATSEDGLNRMAEVEAENPSVVLLCFGGNDTLRSVSHDQTFANIAAMIDRFHLRGSFVVLIGVRSASVFDKYESKFKALAAEKKVFYVPNILSGVLASPNLMSDQIHPNEAGYKFIADRIQGLLLPLLPKLSPAT